MAPATIYKWIDLYSKSNESSVSKADFLELKRQLAKVKEERDIYNFRKNYKISETNIDNRFYAEKQTNYFDKINQ